MGAIDIGGIVLANGGSGGSASVDGGGGGGGGAGGGILVHAPVVSLLGALHATGGAGGTGSPANGGPGGGGRVLILTADGTLESGTLDANVNVGNGVKELEASDLFNQPPVAQCQDLTVAAGPGCTATASIDNGSFDPDADLLTLTQAPPGPYALGATSVTLTAADPLGLSSSCSAIVTVRDLDAPVIQLHGAEP